MILPHRNDALNAAIHIGLLATAWIPASVAATTDDATSAQADPKARLEELNKRTEGLAQRMDGLSAEAQDLIWNNTNEKLTTFLKDIDTAMLDARDLLEQFKTGGDTVAAQQDVLEKIYEAAKKASQKSQQQQQQQQQDQQNKDGEGKPGEGKPGEGKPGEGKPGEGKPGEGKPGEGKPGEGQQGEQDDGGMSSMLKMMEQMLGITPPEQPAGKPGGDKSGNGDKEGPGKGDDSAVNGPANKAMSEQRTVPRASGNSSGLLPPEYRDRMESFRKGLDQIELDDARAPQQP